MLRGVCCLLLVVPRVAVGDWEPVPAVSRAGAPEAPLPDFVAGAVGVAEAEGVPALAVGCGEGCCLAGACGNGRPGR